MDSHLDNIAGYIYALKDPNTHRVKYVGLTVNVQTRYKQHLETCNKEKSPKAKWIRSLLKSGKKPCLDVLDIVTGLPSDLAAAEVYWINEMRDSGEILLNSNKGGQLGGNRGRSGVKPPKDKPTVPTDCFRLMQRFDYERASQKSRITHSTSGWLYQCFEMKILARDTGNIELLELVLDFEIALGRCRFTADERGFVVSCMNFGSHIARERYGTRFYPLFCSIVDKIEAVETHSSACR